MADSNPELRAELRRLTNPPENAGLDWLDLQIQEVEDLSKRIPHGIRLHTRSSTDIDRQNCFMCALGIKADAVADMCVGHIFPGKKFMQYLLRGVLHERKGTPQDDDIVVYFRNGVPEHAGIWKSGKVISKWGSGRTYIWEHALWEVSEEYGDEVRYFEALPTAVEAYLTWARDRGL